MKKNNDLEEFIKRLEEAVEKLQDSAPRPILIDISINLYPTVIPAEPCIQVERKTPVDILETERNIHAVIGLPGLEMENIKLSCTGQVLEITASNEQGTLKETIELPVKVNKRGMRSTYKNGILEVIFNKPKKAVKKSNI